MAQQLRIFSVLAEDQVCFPTPTKVAHSFHTSGAGDSLPFFGLCNHQAHVCGTYTYLQENTQTQNKIKSFFGKE